DQDWVQARISQRVYLWMVPYFRNANRQIQAFQEARASAQKYPNITRILAFHCEIKGCERTAYTKGEGITLDDIGASDYHLCVSGHIHRPQRLAKNVFYAGSPFCCDWGEVNETKSLLVADISESTSMMNMQRIPSRVPGWHDPSAPGFKQPVRWDNCHVLLT